MPVANSVMSAPAEKNRPVPVSTMAFTAGSALASANAFSRPVRRAWPSAFTGGLFMRMTATSPCFSVSTTATVRSCPDLFASQPRLGAGGGQRLLSCNKAIKGGCAMLRGMMMDRPLLVSSVIDYAAEIFPEVQVVSQTVEGGLHRYGYAQARERIGRLANALVGLGIKPGDRVATLAWNGYRHFELYYAISGIGAVCHTINPRLFPEQITYIANHAEDSALFFDLTFLPLVEKLAPALKSVRAYVAMTDREHMPPASPLPGLLCYEGLLAEMPADITW